MSGLQRICKLHGSMIIKSKGNTVTWLWDYVNDKPRLKSDMTTEEIMQSENKKSEIAKK